MTYDPVPLAVKGLRRRYKAQYRWFAACKALNEAAGTPAAPAALAAWEKARRPSKQQKHIGYGEAYTILEALGLEVPAQYRSTLWVWWYALHAAGVALPTPDVPQAVV